MATLMKDLPAGLSRAQAISRGGYAAVFEEDTADGGKEMRDLHAKLRRSRNH